MSYKFKHQTLIVISAVLAITLPFYISLSWTTPLIIFALYFFTKGIGSEIGAHRLWSHRSFTTTWVWERVLIVLDTLSGEGSIVAFTGVHRLHHAHSDTVRDPHNPHTHFWSTIFYQHNTTEFNTKLIKDLIRDPWLVWQHKNYFNIQLILMLALLVSSPLALWYYSVNILVTMWTNFLVNVVCHKYGTNDNNLNNTSKNNRWADLFLLGVGPHNNHHANPGNFRNNWGRYRIDIWGNIIDLIRIKNDHLTSNNSK